MTNENREILIEVTFNNPFELSESVSQKAFSAFFNGLVEKLGVEYTEATLEISAREWGYYSGYSLECKGTTLVFTHVSLL